MKHKFPSCCELEGDSLVLTIDLFAALLGGEG